MSAEADEVMMEKTNAIKQALANWFECEPDDIGYFIVGCERQLEQGATFSSVYSMIPHWYLFGFVEELRLHIEHARDSEQKSSVVERMISENGADS